MDTKPLLFAIIGFLLGGLVVSTAATLLDDDSEAGSASMSQMTDDLTDKDGDDFDAAFIDTMIEHHRGAIEMARLADTRAEHSEIKELSAAIIDAQESEIAQMERWREEWGYEKQASDHGGGH